VCVDYRYLKDQFEKQTSEELKHTKYQAERNLTRQTTLTTPKHSKGPINHQKHHLQGEQDEPPFLLLSPPPKVVIKKIEKSIQVKEQEHD